MLFKTALNLLNVSGFTFTYFMYYLFGMSQCQEKKYKRKMRNRDLREIS